MTGFGTAETRPGAISRGELTIAHGMDGRPVSIPLTVVCGAKPGPTLLIEGGIHGIEIVTIEICRRLAAGALNPAELAGTVVMAPVINPWAFHASSRHTPHDQLDMNRVFPGKGASLTHRAASVIARDLLDRADYLIDCHSCNPPSLHFTITSPDGSPEVRDTSLRMAKAFGYPLIGASAGNTGTIRGHFVASGKPAITPEFVFSRRIDAVSAETGVRGMLNVLRELGMLPGAVEPNPVPGAFEGQMDYMVLSAERGGIVSFQRECGDRVAAGEALAVLHDIWGDEVETIRAPVPGILLAYPIAGNQCAATGDKLVYLAHLR